MTFISWISIDVLQSGILSRTEHNEEGSSPQPLSAQDLVIGATGFECLEGGGQEEDNSDPEPPQTVEGSRPAIDGQDKFGTSPEPSLDPFAHPSWCACVAQDGEKFPEDLRRVIEVWERLPDEVRKAILVMIEG